jgi:hypothetical protein
MHSVEKSAGSFSQCSPLSRERKSAGGAVPANIVFGSVGSMAIRQTL